MSLVDSVSNEAENKQLVNEALHGPCLLAPIKNWKYSCTPTPYSPPSTSALGPGLALQT